MPSGIALRAESFLTGTGITRAGFEKVMSEKGGLGALATQSVKMLLAAESWFATRCRTMPAPLIRAVLEALPEKPEPYALFLRMAVDPSVKDEVLEATWVTALESIGDIEVTYPLGSAKRREKLEALARRPAVMAAMQGTVVGCKKVPYAMLAALVSEGSEASIDALMPYFKRVTEAKDRSLDRLVLLQKHAKPSPSMTVLFAEATSSMLDRNALSPALQLAQNVLGLGELATFRFDAMFGSKEMSHGAVPRFQVSAFISSERAEWYQMSMTRLGDYSVTDDTTAFGSNGLREDALKLGASAPSQWPEWLERAEKTLGIRWNVDSVTVTSSIRGKKREAILDWLLKR